MVTLELVMSRHNMSLLITLTIILFICFAAITVAYARDTTQFGGDPGYDTIHVRDGDTFVLNGQPVRLAFVDAPERGQPFYSESKELLTNMLASGNLRCTQTGRSYDRIVASCSVMNEDVGYRLVREGLAVHDTRYTIGTTALYLSGAQMLARLSKRGIWSQERIILPKDYRSGAR